MPVWRLQVAIGGDTAFPRDKAVITPHFNDSGVGTDPQGLCDDMADIAVAFFATPGPRQIEVTAYDAQGTPPVDPQGYAVRNLGIIQETGSPREVACCLSFFGVRNAPRFRGRLYIPAYASLAPGAMGGRPSVAYREKIGTLATSLAGLGGADVDWVVYSRLTDTAIPVSNWWVDDEWDTIRSRGLRATTRLAGTVNE
jgi:hypothetical protein